ncbi:MAG: translation initiation factor IF-3 C-terminal domain-containing protein, partial [Solirubrobacterales bacterium]|nr:translation initiation factor IF-3 C-terminal domain-containing protein [Solirubrobacterales bacterium]
LRHKDNVKITIMFRGREMAHPDRGRALLERIAEELVELAVVEQSPLQDGRNMTMMIAPSKALIAELANAERVAKDGAATETAPVEEAVPVEVQAPDAPETVEETPEVVAVETAEPDGTDSSAEPSAADSD